MKKTSFYTSKDVEDTLGVGRNTAYKIIKELNAELKAKGYRTVRGKISKTYLEERYGL